MARGGTAAAALRELREEGEVWATEWREGSGGAGRCPDQGVEEAGCGAPNAGVRPPRGRRWMGRGGRRALEREGEGEAGRAAGWAEREAGLAQQRLSPFLFFLNFFSQILSKLIWTI